MIDCIARRPLWQVGLEYRHGTGHGVGSFLNVHEGPHGIGTRIGYNETGLQAGMTVTNGEHLTFWLSAMLLLTYILPEPGYYQDGEFGIRIENILIVREAVSGFLKFEHVTFFPLDRKLIEPALLDNSERDWINSYHEECWSKVSPLLPEGSDARAWLRRETLPLA